MILNSTRQLELKAAVSLCPALALAWKISGLPHSSSAMELVERATTLLTSWASGWPLLRNSLSSTGRKVKPSRLEISDPASVAVKSVPRITKNKSTNTIFVFFLFYFIYIGVFYLSAAHLKRTKTSVSFFPFFLRSIPGSSFFILYFIHHLNNLVFIITFVHALYVMCVCSYLRGERACQT